MLRLHACIDATCCTSHLVGRCQRRHGWLVSRRRRRHSSGPSHDVCAAGKATLYLRACTTERHVPGSPRDRLAFGCRASAACTREETWNLRNFSRIFGLLDLHIAWRFALCRQQARNALREKPKRSPACAPCTTKGTIKHDNTLQPRNHQTSLCAPWSSRHRGQTDQDYSRMHSDGRRGDGSG
jgi:hypothetical protein